MARRSRLLVKVSGIEVLIKFGDGDYTIVVGVQLLKFLGQLVRPLLAATNFSHSDLPVGILVPFKKVPTGALSLQVSLTVGTLFKIQRDFFKSLDVVGDGLFS